jgi:hypothetical protein
MRKYLVIVILNLAGMSMTTGQNLVLNPSLEDTVCLPNIDYYLPADYWFKPSLGSSDYFNLSLAQNFCYIVTTPAAGIQIAKDGYAFAGFATYVISNPDRREYVGVKLIDSLRVGHDYCIEYFVSLAGRSRVANGNFGVYFSVDSVNEFGWPNTLSYTPQVYYSGPPITDTLGWTLLSGVYTATGGERFICIGNFNTGVNTDTINLPTGDVYGAYYYIDDVNIYDCTVGLSESTSNSINVYPNPFQDKLFIEIGSAFSRSHIEISDFYGRLVHKSTKNLGQNTLEMNLSFLADGVYYCSIYSESGKVVKKLVKHSD